MEFLNLIKDWFLGLTHVEMALTGTLFTWFLTALGAAMVFFFKEINQKLHRYTKFSRGGSGIHTP